MRHRPIHTFRVELSAVPGCWVAVRIWRTLGEMRKAMGPMGMRGAYEALCEQPQRGRWQLAVIHLALTRSGPDVVAHEAFHAASHVARLKRLCHTADEERLAGLLDAMVSGIIRELDGLK